VDERRHGRRHARRPDDQRLARRSTDYARVARVLPRPGFIQFSRRATLDQRRHRRRHAADQDDDDRLDAHEPRLAGALVWLDGNDNGVFDAGELGGRTNALGQIAFDNLMPGQYVVRQLPIEGYTLASKPKHLTLTADEAVRADFSNRKG
jgi:hypothetical protein